MKIVIAVLVALMSLPMSALADANLKKGLAKAQYMLRQATTEKVALQKQIDELKSQLQARDAEINALQRSVKKEQGRAGKLASNNGVWQTEYEKLKGMYVDTKQDLAKAVRYGEVQDQRFALQSENFDMCMAKNKAMYDLNMELHDAYGNKSFVDALQENDPFLGLKKVELENLMQEFEYRIEDESMRENMHLVQEIDPVPANLIVN